MKCIINGKVILPDRVADNLAIVFDEQITNISPVSDLDLSEYEVIDAEGKYVSPGLIDIHIHGYMGKDTCEAEKDGMKTIAEGLIEKGVTGFLPTTMTIDLEDVKKALQVLRDLKEESKTWKGSEILGCHAEGPFINVSKKGGQNEKFVIPPDAEFVKEYSDIIKIISLAPETDSNNFEAIREINKETNVVVSMGHTDADYDTAIAGVANGVKHATHLFNAMSPLSHRSPGVVGAALTSDVSCELITDTFHVSPHLYDMVWKLKGRKLCFITDCLAAGGLPYGEYMFGGQKMIYRDIVCRLEDGTIAGSVVSLNKGVWNVYTNSNIPLNECVNCASLNPATTIGIADKKGSLEIGKDADIIICDEEFNVYKTFKKGVVKYEH